MSVPLLGVTKPFRQRNSVDLPAPDGPSKTVKAPSSNDTDVGCSARVPLGKVTSAACSSIAVVMTISSVLLQPIVWAAPVSPVLTKLSPFSRKI
jgi:hypothetical protein